MRLPKHKGRSSRRTPICGRHRADDRELRTASRGGARSWRLSCRAVAFGPTQARRGRVPSEGCRSGAPYGHPEMKPGSMLRRVTVFGALLLPLACALAADTQAPGAQVQFGGECAEGLAQGQHVAANCAITWTDKDGKVYCFSSEASKKTFLQDPNGNLQKARDFAAAASVEATEKAMQNYTSSDAEALVKTNIEQKTTG